MSELFQSRNNPATNQVASITATASLNDLVMPPVPGREQTIGFIQEFIGNTNPQAGYLADMLPTASPMATTALNARISQLAGGVGVLALAFGALKQMIQQGDQPGHLG